MYDLKPTKGAHAPPPADPRAFDIFYIFWSNSPQCGLFLCSNAPLPRDFLGVKCPVLRAEVTKPRLISGNLNEVFNTAISIIFCTPVQRLRSSYFFCVHSDHLGSRYELSQCVRNIAIVSFKTRKSPRARISTF